MSNVTKEKSSQNICESLLSEYCDISDRELFVIIHKLFTNGYALQNFIAIWFYVGIIILFSEFFNKYWTQFLSKIDSNREASSLWPEHRNRNRAQRNYCSVKLCQHSKVSTSCQLISCFIFSLNFSQKVSTFWSNVRLLIGSAWKFPLSVKNKARFLIVLLLSSLFLF